MNTIVVDPEQKSSGQDYFGYSEGNLLYTLVLENIRQENSHYQDFHSMLGLYVFHDESLHTRLPARKTDWLVQVINPRPHDWDPK